MVATKEIKTISKTFSHFVKNGNINRALKLLSENPTSGVLTLSDEVLEQIKIKHPDAKPK